MDNWSHRKALMDNWSPANYQGSYPQQAALSMNSYRSGASEYSGPLAVHPYYSVSGITVPYGHGRTLADNRSSTSYNCIMARFFKLQLHKSSRIA